MDGPYQCGEYPDLAGVHDTVPASERTPLTTRGVVPESKRAAVLPLLLCSPAPLYSQLPGKSERKDKPVRDPRLKTWACSRPPLQFTRTREVLMLQLHRTPHQGPLTTAPPWPSLPSKERSVQGAHTSCFPAHGSARHTPVVSSKGPPSDGGVGALRSQPFSPHSRLPGLPDLLGVHRRGLLATTSRTFVRAEGDVFPPMPQGRGYPRQK